MSGAPGTTVLSETALSMAREATTERGVVSVSLLLAGVGSAPLPPSSATEALLLICVTPGATTALTLTAKACAWLAPPPLRAPMERVQVVPAGLPLAVESVIQVLFSSLPRDWAHVG